MKEAMRQLIQAKALCQKYGLHDQTEDSMFVRLGLRLGTKVWSDLESLDVIETPKGYKYVLQTKS
ncbi:MAG: hypothetical protein ACE5GV_02945 [Candidatus Scalindua sp.]